MIRVRRGDYGYDAPYFPAIFGLLSVAAGLGATISWWQGLIRPAMQMTLYFVFFLANTSSFLYTTRRGKFLEWDRILDHLHLRGVLHRRADCHAAVHLFSVPVFHSAGEWRKEFRDVGAEHRPVRQRAHRQHTLPRPGGRGSRRADAQPPGRSGSGRLP